MGPRGKMSIGAYASYDEIRTPQPLWLALGNRRRCAQFPARAAYERHLAATRQPCCVRRLVVGKTAPPRDLPGHTVWGCFLSAARRRFGTRRVEAPVDVRPAREGEDH